MNPEKRQQVMSIIHAALAAVDPAAAIRRSIARLCADGPGASDCLQLHSGPAGCPLRYPLDRYRQIHVIGAGKAGAAMAAALEELLGDRLSSGIVIVKEGYTAPTRSVRLVEASHPVPDRRGLAATRQIMELAAGAGPDDLVIALISGGASALLTAPVDSVTLADLQSTTDALLRCGATINEFNTVRKHLSQVKGGRLGQLVAPATLLTLVISDVVGSPLDIIGSGPTVPDPSTFSAALEVIARYQLEDQIPASVLAHLHQARCETPKPGDPLFDRVHTTIIAGNELAASAAVDRARQLGYHTMLLTTFLQGQAREVGVVMAAIAQEIRHHGRPLTPPACIVAGGETTVTVRGAGRGGRNQELALAAAIHLDGLENAAIIGLATDGTDGPTPAAGAWAGGATVRRATALGLSAARYLADNDAYTFFHRLDDLIVTGPTNNNVNDLALIFVW